MTGALIAMGIGVVASSVIHLSQGLMKLGIQRMRATRPQPRARMIYALGLGLNFSAPFWVMLANPFAPTIYFTSMYAVGLIVLLWFSCTFLGETLRLRQFAGVGIIIAATLIIAGGELVHGAIPMDQVALGPFMSMAVVWLVTIPLLGLWFQHRTDRVREVFFGLAAGGFLALDALVKGLAQSGMEGSTFLPQTGLGWGLLVLSFLGAAGAFGMMQWAYVRECRAPIVAANYNVGYVTLPLLFVPLATAGGAIGWWCVVGVGLLVVGVITLSGEQRGEGPSSRSTENGNY